MIPTVYEEINELNNELKAFNEKLKKLKDITLDGTDAEYFSAVQIELLIKNTEDFSELAQAIKVSAQDILKNKQLEKQDK
ncbi:hypothetical protein WKH56_09385 [Priestia sp. SB1]|uniref:hypothetical protein n=1 Tax=Priestia sp. SB1 TaxID=3132359 RepID=UPI0031721157